ncbi:MAG: hypothetical protein K0R45_3220, partial [Pseudomonas sp.]|nr:hypothetical protein [Pseudomonas sp.]
AYSIRKGLKALRRYFSGSLDGERMSIYILMEFQSSGYNQT